MSYARFSEGDVYIFAHTGGFYMCQCCPLQKKVSSIFCNGTKDDPLFGDIEPCKKCNGKGCDDCMMYDDYTCDEIQELIDHVKDHEKAGHDFPDRLMERLEEELKNEI